MSKVTAVKNNIGQIELEFHPDLGIMVHIDIFEWTVSNFRQSIKIWKTFMEELDTQGFDIVCAAIPADDTKNKRFAALYGFKPTTVKLTKDKVLLDIWSYKLGDT